MTMNKFITFVPRHQASAVCRGGKEQETGGEDNSPQFAVDGCKRCGRNKTPLAGVITQETNH